MKNEPFVIERTFKAPASKVWEAITNKDKMKEWYFDFKEFKPEVGFEFDFYGGPDGRQYHHVCKIITVIPMKKLAYSWRYDGHEGNSLVTFELFDEGSSTRLNLHTMVWKHFRQTIRILRNKTLKEDGLKSSEHH